MERRQGAQVCTALTPLTPDAQVPMQKHEKHRPTRLLQVTNFIVMAPSEDELEELSEFKRMILSVSKQLQEDMCMP